MHGEQQDVFFFCEAQQSGAQQRTVLKVEGTAGFVLCEASDFVGLCTGREGVQRQCEFQFRSDALNGLAIVLRERRAKAFVTRNERVQSGMKRGNIEGAAQTQGNRDVIGRLSGVELLEEPQTFLREGQRQMRGARKCLQRR
ncbi:hypothetical protein NK8_53320 (plasmid) [Caballeronia sp. NK8]|nr:hypothetical protein NK8_53320 [Caballeronia sp. NK8]